MADAVGITQPNIWHIAQIFQITMPLMSDEGDRESTI